MVTARQSDTAVEVTRAAREQRILDGMPLVKRIAHWFAATVPRSVDAADLVSAGTLGLIRAVDAFDPQRGVAFDVFAARCIRGAVLDHLRAQDPLPYSTRVKVRRLQESLAALQNTLQRTPSLSELAEAVGCTEQEVSSLQAEASGASFDSIEVRMDDGDDVRDDAAPDVLAGIESRQLQEVLVRLIEALPPMERLILTLYYYEGLKMREIGAVLKITESRVSQLHTSAVTSLRADLKETLSRRE
jgi:RNA polymerase sigma factor for flagellar operon FliA